MLKDFKQVLEEQNFFQQDSNNINKNYNIYRRLIDKE